MLDPDARTLLDVLANGAVDTDAVAIRDTDRAMTYGELDRRSWAVAQQLIARGAGRGTRVGIVISRTADVVVNILGILRSGSSYVPLDPEYPQSRLEFIVLDARIQFVVAGTGDDVSDAFGGLDVVRATELSPDAGTGVDSSIRPGTTHATHAAADEDDEAYVIYTSGSTGPPKGCSITHRNVVSLLRAALPQFDVGRDDRWTLFHSCTFDFSVWEVWGALATGGSVVMVPKTVALDAAKLSRLCREQEVTVLNMVPSVFRSLAVHLDRTGEQVPVRYVIFGGERLAPDDLVTFMRGVSPDLPPRLVNMYGITETTVHVTFKELGAADLDRTDGYSPIGIPLPHLRVRLLGEDGEDVPDGTVGEMFVCGDGVSSGYVERPDLTNERFVSIDGTRYYRSGDLALRTVDGSLLYAGRNDDQVKINGFRVEVGEVEAAMRQHGRVLDAGVVVAAESGGAPRLWGAVVTDQPLDDIDLRSFLIERLPSHVVPARIHRVDRLPHTASGKLDRRRLAEIVGAGALSSADTGITNSSFGSAAEVTALLASLWTTVLGTDDFDHDEGFFEVGGDSLSIALLHDSLARQFPALGLKVVDLYRFPSVRTMADRIWKSLSDSALSR